LTPTASNARCSAVVQLATAQACGAPTRAANSRSNAATSGPCVTQPLRITRRAASASASSITGFMIGMMVEFMSELRRAPAPGGHVPVVDDLGLQQLPGRHVAPQVPALQ